MFLNDAITGQPIAECQVPAGFAVQATINGTIQSFGRPYSATVELLREDQRGMLFFHSGECFHQIKFGQGERHVEAAGEPERLSAEGDDVFIGDEDRDDLPAEKLGTQYDECGVDHRHDGAVPETELHAVHPIRPVVLACVGGHTGA